MKPRKILTAAALTLALGGPLTAPATAAPATHTAHAAHVNASPATVSPAAAASATVKLAQTDLNGLAYPAGTPDGVAGSKTKAATQSFQSDRCLTIDGAIGPQTLGALKGVVEQVQGKAEVTASGTYGSSTAKAVKTYQHAHHLTADGIAGSTTMKSMHIARTVASCHSTSALRAKIVKVAKSQLGVRADGRNCVPGKPYSVCADWCAAFATWVWRDAGVNIPYMTYVPSVYNWAVDHHKWLNTSHLGSAQPGDLIIFGSAHNRYHIGVVDHVSGHTVRVVSGNTSNPAHPSQIGVYDKTYTLSGSVFYGLVRP
jgi:Putative peptidoglycan binding domain/CHAP domain